MTMQFQRKFNYTGRKRLNKSDVEIRLIHTANAPPSFAVAINFSEVNISGDARVIVEARQRDIVQRFDCGTVESFCAPTDTRLTDLDPDSPLSFWVRVVDSSRPDRRLVAVARSIRPVGGDEDATGRDSLLSLKCKDLGQLPWTVEYPESEDDIPRLVINSRIPSAMDRLRTDPVWQALVFPAAMREIFAHILQEPGAQADEGHEEWQCKWLEHGARLSGQSILSNDLSESPRDWIDECARRFSEIFALTSRMVATDKDGQQ